MTKYSQVFFVSELASLVQTAIEKVNETGAVIISITCDNPAVNHSMLNQLGANISYRDLKCSLNYMNVMNIPILVTLDACHLFKLVRNCFGTYKVLKDSNGDTINWCYIEELEKVQLSEGFHLANKLRQKHILWTKNKMSTVLALQVLSNSVADSIDYCREVLGLKQFKGSEATTNFLRVFNNLFDVLNSKSKYGKHLKGPLVKTDSSFISMFEKTRHYITTLRLPNEKLLIESPRNRVFVGLLVLMKSVEKLYNAYIRTNQLSYLLTFKLSQDHLGMSNFQFKIKYFVLSLNWLHNFNVMDSITEQYICIYIYIYRIVKEFV